MKIFVILEFCFVVILSASANQVQTVPIQQYPVYQQSVYNTPAIPVVYQAAGYNNPCNPQNIVQTPTPNQIASAFVSKVLSNPTINSILDLNSRYYNQHGEEVRKQLYNTAPVPNIINNYFIVSPEYLKFNESELIAEVLAPQNVNNGASFNAENKVDALTVPQNNVVTKENLVQASTDNTQNNAASQLTTPRRKVRRKKTKKRIRSKLIPPLINRVQEIQVDIPMQPESTPKDIESNLGNGINEEVTSHSKSHISEDKEVKVERSSIEMIKQEVNSTTSSEKPKKKSKKRNKSKTAKDSERDANIEALRNNHIDTNKDNSEINLEHHQEIPKNNEDSVGQKSMKNVLNNEHIIQDTSRGELNEQCFTDIGSLLSCLDEAECRVTRNSNDDAILRDFLQKFPQVPENVARSMLSYAQHQYQNQMNSNYFYPGNIPQGFNHLFQMPFLNNFGKSNVGESKPKISRNRKNRRKKGQNKKRKRPTTITTPYIVDTTTESITSTVDNIVTDVETTTDLHLQLEETTSTDTNPTIASTVTETLLPITEEISTDYEYSVEPKQTHVDLEEASVNYEETEIGNREDHISELDDQAPVPLIYTNGLIDDYYPTFFDSDFYANNNEFTVADVSDRYYYTTDRNIDTTSRDRTKFEINFRETIPKLIKHGLRDTRPKHTYFDADRESYKNLVKDIIQPKVQFKPPTTPKTKEETFKTPPGLDNPDFRTKRVDKNAFKSEKVDDSFDDVGKYLDYGEKSSIYSDAKTPLFNSRSKPSADTGFVLERPVAFSGSDVETSFARSKVAKYGAEESYENVSPEVYHADDDYVSIVTPESLRYSDYTW